MLKTMMKMIAVGAMISLAACGEYYNSDVSAANAPTATLNFAGHDADFPSGTYFIDVKGVYDNGTASGTCTTTFSGCYPITPGATPVQPANAGESHTTAMESLCSGNWVFTDSAAVPGNIKLRDTSAAANACDFNVPHIADCVVDGTYDAASAAGVLVDSATDLSPAAGFRLRLRPNDNFVRVTCTLTNANVTFDVGIQ